jgi:hypothetical protein
MVLLPHRTEKDKGMKLTCKCGAYIEINENVSSHRDAFLSAHAACLQPEVHNHQHFNLDSNFWLNTFAGAAIQGILAHHASNWFPQSSPEALASCAVKTAKALLKELEVN